MAKSAPARASLLNSGAFRFALIFAVIFACASLGMLGMVQYQIGRYAHQAQVGSLENETATLMAGGEKKIIDNVRLRMAATPQGNFSYLIVDSAGRPTIGTVPLAAARTGWNSISMRESGDMQVEDLMALGTRLRDGSLLVVATDAFDISWTRGRTAWVMLLWAAAITLAALSAGWIAASIFLKRLRAANIAVEEIMRGHTERRLPMIGLAPELDELARNLNRMLDRIQGLMEGLRQVSTDVAHDLRTPLTRLLQMLENARDSDEAHEKQVAIDMAIGQASQVLATFRAILRLAQIEGGGRRTAFKFVDLHALLLGLSETYEPVASDAGHTLVLTGNGAVFVKGDQELLAQLFANLIENAILHTPAGSAIRIEIETDKQRSSVSVIDNGDGVAPEKRLRLTERFYQVDPSRSQGGAGLGLAMANAITHLHGARLEINDAQPGLRVRIDFPTSDA